MRNPLWRLIGWALNVAFRLTFYVAKVFFTVVAAIIKVAFSGLFWLVALVTEMLRSRKARRQRQEREAEHSANQARLREEKAARDARVEAECAEHNAAVAITDDTLQKVTDQATALLLGGTDVPTVARHIADKLGLDHETALSILTSTIANTGLTGTSITTDDVKGKGNE